MHDSPEGGTREGPGQPRSAAEAFGLARSLSWFDGFSIALGVPALMLFSVGSIVVLTGTLSPFIWIISVLVGLAQAFIFAQMAGTFPRKSGGHSLYGAEAWKHRNRFLPPLTVWGNWFAWSPVLAIGALLIGQYVQTTWWSSSTWSWDASPFHINIATVIGAVVLLGVFWVNHFSIKDSARIQQILGVISLLPIALLIVVPVLEGKLDFDNLGPVEPPGGDWLAWGTFETIAAGLFVAAWSAYAFETTICYTAEFKDPGRDAPKAILGAGLLNLVFYGLGPVVLLGVVGPERIANDASVAFAPLAEDTFGTGSDVLIALLIVAFILIINTAILGSARTLYQASADGYTLSGLTKLNKRRVPTRAMGFDVAVNMLLLSLGNPIAILAASTVGYMFTNIIDLTGGYLLDKDTRHMKVPYRAPRALMRFAPAFAAFNFVLLFAGGPSWGWEEIGLGWAIVLLSIPLYLWRQRTDRTMQPPKQQPTSTQEAVELA